MQSFFFFCQHFLKYLSSFSFPLKENIQLQFVLQIKAALWRDGTDGKRYCADVFTFWQPGITARD